MAKGWPPKMTTRKENIAITLLLIVWTLAIVAPVEFGTIAIQDILPNTSMFDRTPLEEAVISHNLDLLLLWPIAATTLFYALGAFLFRTQPSNQKGHN